MTMKTIKEIEDFGEFLSSGFSFKDCCFQGIDFTKIHISWHRLRFENCIFLGCKIPTSAMVYLNDSECLVFPAISGLPYEVYRSVLYTWQELFALSSDLRFPTVDEQIYNHFLQNRHNGTISEHLFQRIHDHSIDDALNDLLHPLDNGAYKKKCIAIMGGHGTKRDDHHYTKVAEIAFLLSQQGYFIASGGGPGIMEAANLGAYMSAYTWEELKTALSMLESDFHYRNPAYHTAALKVLERFPSGAESLAIPTWFYGHEPSNLFSTYIAKYFSNSIREDNLLAIALNGIVFAPGSAGTNQEIFMDAAQNHYGTFSYFSPMVFLGRKHYIDKTGLYPLLERLARSKEYGKLLFLSDDVNEIVEYLLQHDPVLKV